MRIPRHQEAAARRRSRDRKRRARDYRASVEWRCEDCGEAHGKLTLVAENTYHRVEVGIEHRNGNRDDWRWKNLRAVCQRCRPNYRATFSSVELSQPEREARA